MARFKLQYLSLALLGCLITACNEPVPRLSQSWADINLIVETRPPRLQLGMNEFIVIASRTQGGAAHDLIVSLRINDSRWHQAIQDGHVGAYRRALMVGNLENDVLYVKIEDDSREGVLRFPLADQKIPVTR